MDLFASEYGWTRDEILDNVFIDEYFTQQKIIDKRKRQNLLMLAQIQLLPHTEEKARKEFFNVLEGVEKATLIGKSIKTDFEAIERAKKTLNN